MPQSPDWKRVIETGMQFTELRRSQAHRLAIDLVAQGQLARDQVGAAVDELIELSRSRSEELRKIVSSEVQRQLAALGLATRNDLAALERRLHGLAKSTAPASGAKKSPTAAAKKAPAKKATATKKAPTKKAATRKSAAKSTSTKTTAAQEGLAKAAARKAPAKKAR